MDSRDRSVDALILQSRDYREQDKLLTIVSAAAGAEKVIARGARKSTGSLRGLAQPMNRVELVLSPAKGGISFIREGMPLESFLVNGEDNLSRFAYGAYMSELTLHAWPEQKTAPELFYLLLACFYLLKLDRDHQRTSRFFELKLLAYLGLLPHDLTSCFVCGQKIMTRRFALSAQRGALICEPCAVDDPSPLLSPGTVMTMQRLLSIPLNKLPSLKLSRPIAAELEEALSYYMNYHLEYSSKAKKILAQLLQ